MVDKRHFEEIVKGEKERERLARGTFHRQRRFFASTFHPHRQSTAWNLQADHDRCFEGGDNITQRLF